ncbi:helix-turn-helix domain-containing protein [Paenibacillus illinoisensis]|uniref:Immunity repressor protein n=1 Tax=Paenibacillus illinoisensis TaxID=59845 RepID=A0A2W0CXE8_9BACL|nr:helix-turn-helix domain-containing protein [Paenibacillus illinoisensis]PYY28321.1 Immunity repressor protein [Paenibacillus illinoisensis]
MQTFSLNNQFGEFLKELRSNKGWSLRKASEESGVSHTYIGMLEKGINTNVSPEQLRKLADAYDQPYNLLMVRAGYKELKPETNVMELMDALQKSINAVKPLETGMDSEEYFDSLEQISIQEPINEWRISNKTPNETIGQRIKYVREKIGYTINDLSEVLTGRFKCTDYEIHKKYPPHYIQSVENGTEDPTSSFLIAFEEYLDVPIVWLLKGDRETSSGLEPVSAYTKEEENKQKMIVTEFNKTAEEAALKLVKEYLDGIAKEVAEKINATNVKTSQDSIEEK